MNFTSRLFSHAGVFLLLIFMSQVSFGQGSAESRPRARDVGLNVGILPTGEKNSITDVRGVRVGHTTIIRGDSIRTGVTAVLPHGGNLYQEKVPAAFFVGNAYGKFMGSTQIEELGEIETPVLLTSTLAVPKVGDFLIDYMLALPGNEGVRSINPVVGETNDGGLNDIRSRSISREDVINAIRSSSENVDEGSVGAGTGTVCYGFKGGIGTSSRKLPSRLGGYTVGVLVQTNFGGILRIDGAPVGKELGRFYLRRFVGSAAAGEKTHVSEDLNDAADGSIIIVIATDAPVDTRNLRRMAARSFLGMARTGAAGTNGSGDYAIAFSAAPDLRIRSGMRPKPQSLLPNNAMSPLFLATIEATEEAIYNSLFRARSITGIGGRRVDALPIDRTIQILKKYKRID